MDCEWSLLNSSGQMQWNAYDFFDESISLLDAEYISDDLMIEESNEIMDSAYPEEMFSPLEIEVEIEEPKPLTFEEMLGFPSMSYNWQIGFPAVTPIFPFYGQTLLAKEEFRFETNSLGIPTNQTIATQTPFGSYPVYTINRPQDKQPVPPLVCNVRIENIRPEFNDLRAWCNSDNNVYISSARKALVSADGSNSKKIKYPAHHSIWSNPFAPSLIQSKEKCIEKYEIYIRYKLAIGEIKKEQLSNLKGKNLGCWCDASEGRTPCHGLVLVKLVKELC